MMVRLKGKIMTINYNQKGKHNDHEATHSHTLSLMWLKKKPFLVEIQYSEVPIENNYQNMLRSTHAEFCAKKLGNREGDLKLAGSPSLYHQSFGLLWTTIIFNCFGWTGSLSQEKHPLVTREDHWIAMLASDAVLAKCLRKTLSCFYVVHSQLLPQWISLNFWKGSGKGEKIKLINTIIFRFNFSRFNWPTS